MKKSKSRKNIKRINVPKKGVRKNGQSRVYAYKDKRVEIEWNFSVDNAAKYGMGVSQSRTT